MRQFQSSAPLGTRAHRLLRAANASRAEPRLLLHPIAIEHRQRLTRLRRQEPGFATDVGLWKVKGGQQRYRQAIV